MAIYTWLSIKKWWFSIVMFVYQRVNPINIPLNHYTIPLNHCKSHDFHRFSLIFHRYFLYLYHVGYVLPSQADRSHPQHFARCAGCAGCAGRTGWRWAGGNRPRDGRGWRFQALAALAPGASNIWVVCMVNICQHVGHTSVVFSFLGDQEVNIIQAIYDEL